MGRREGILEMRRMRMNSGEEGTVNLVKLYVRLDLTRRVFLRTDADRHVPSLKSHQQNTRRSLSCITHLDPIYDHVVLIFVSVDVSREETHLSRFHLPLRVRSRC